MDLFGLLALVITLTALFGYVNHRWLGLPRAIGLLLMGLGISGFLVVVRSFPGFERTAQTTVAAVDFERLVLHGVLGFLLFAGALHLDLSDLRRHALVIGVLSTAGVVLSTAIVGWLTWYILALLGHPLPLIHCLLFGPCSLRRIPSPCSRFSAPWEPRGTWRSRSPANRCSTTGSAWSSS